MRAEEHSRTNRPRVGDDWRASVGGTRRKTLSVGVGGVYMGSEHPLRIQSMTTTNTMDVQATAAQIALLHERGSDYVRLTVPSLREAKNLANIQENLRRRKIRVPLVADVHFTPHAAEESARIVEKVRINPGNYAEKKIAHLTGERHEERVAEELRKHFLPLLKICKEHGTALRIGTNHGSLSKRMLFRYGDTPMGMVESALEYVRICHEEGYQDVVLSMKASRPKLMLAAYRLLVVRLQEEGLPSYPLHLGVTEAGDGEDGRVKSALGIAPLLAEGIGDTIRVSLTEPPENELPVARAIIAHGAQHQRGGSNTKERLKVPQKAYLGRDSKVDTHKVLNVGGSEVPRVVADVSPLWGDKKSTQRAKTLAQAADALGRQYLPAADRATFNKTLALLGHHYRPEADEWTHGDQACDYLYTGAVPCLFPLPRRLYEILDYPTWRALPFTNRRFPLVRPSEYFSLRTTHKVTPAFLALDVAYLQKDECGELLKATRKDRQVILVLFGYGEPLYFAFRWAVKRLQEEGIRAPIIWRQDTTGRTESIVPVSLDVGGNLVSGYGQGTWLRATTERGIVYAQRLAFGVLQASGLRVSKPEYIACPSCGRTLFDLEEVTQQIRGQTSHLKGLKIGIMGCIVNGPGEMADADYGYVGSGRGKVTLYRNREIVQRSIPSERAVDALIALIKQDGRWVEKHETRGQ